MAKMTGNVKKSAVAKKAKAAAEAPKATKPVETKAAATEPKKLSKRQTVIATMVANKAKSADEVVKLAAAALGESEAYARHLYKYCVKHQLADGEVLVGGRGRGASPTSKRQQAIVLMKDNEGKTMAELIPLIMSKNGQDENQAKGLYKYIVMHQLAPGVFVKAERKLKAQLPGSVKKNAEALKSPEEVAALKEASAKRLAEVKQKLDAKKKKQDEAAAVVAAAEADKSVDEAVPGFLRK